MSKKSNKYDGSVLFDGTIRVTVKGQKKTLRIDYLGTMLHSVDPKKEVLMLTRNHQMYNEIDTGYVTVKKEWLERDNPVFLLRPSLDVNDGVMLEFADVVAWGYVDGGLNDSRKACSCQYTPEAYAELERERAAVRGKDTRGCAVMKFRKRDDGGVDVATVVDKGCLSDYAVVVENHLADCLKSFTDFGKKHKGVCEVHFYTKPTKWEE